MPPTITGRSFSLFLRRPGAATFFLLSWPLMLVGALWGSVALFTCSLALSYVSDWKLSGNGGGLDKALRNARFPATVRFALRQVMLLLLLVQAGASAELLTAAVVALVAYYFLQVPQSVLLHRVQNARKLPLATRNIDWTALRLRDAPPRALTSNAFAKSMHADVPAMAGLLAGAATGTRWPGYLGCGAMVGYCLGYALLLAVAHVRGRGMPGKGAVFGHVDAWLRRYEPTVMLYFSGTKGSAYQANMWLRTLAESGGRPLVVLRERHILEQLDPTPLPVLCLPSAQDVMNRDFSSVELVLYPANVGPNIHVLRMRQAKHVFIGHGDSDKVASVNPYAKVYDQVWTAGRAGRDRWADAGVGVRDSAVFEVGRPQLAGVERAGQREPGAPLTVLYAPTWEGWTNEPGDTSLISSGEALIKALLALEQPVRVLYRPHPYTGMCAPEAREAHQAVVAALDRANAQRADQRNEGARDGSAVEAAQAELQRVTAELTALSNRARAGADDAERSRDAQFTRADAARREELRRRRDALYWSSADLWQHRYITAQGPDLYSCFNACDLLVSDVSSVVSDFMASEKPYAITDVVGLGEAEFRRRYPTAGAAYLLSRDVHEVAEVVARVAEPGEDPLAAERRRLRRYLLGPDTPDAATRFHAAMGELLQTPDRVVITTAGPHPADTGPRPADEPTDPDAPTSVSAS